MVFVLKKFQNRKINHFFATLCSRRGRTGIFDGFLTLFFDLSVVGVIIFFDLSVAGAFSVTSTPTVLLRLIVGIFSILTETLTPSIDERLRVMTLLI